MLSLSALYPVFQYESLFTIASSKDNKWEKLYDRIPEHQESISHKKCYVAWRNFQKVIGCSATISVQLNRSIENEAAIWKALLHRIYILILQVVLFLNTNGKQHSMIIYSIIHYCIINSLG